MAQTTFRLQHAFQNRSGDSKDMYVNDFHFVAEAAQTVENFTALATAVKAFFAGGVQQWYSTAALGPGRSIKIYDLNDIKPRPPKYSELQFAEIAAGVVQTLLPEEVAVCMSYEGLHVAGGIIGRRRGRIYLGPLNTSCLDNAQPYRPLVKPEMASQVCDNANTLMGAALALGFTWVVHSTVAGTNATLGRVWVDNAFDTVRGRGKDSTARVVIEGAPFEVGV